MIEVRVATHRDVESIVEIGEQFWSEHYYSKYGEFNEYATRMTLHGLVDGDASVLIVAADEGSIIGYIAFIVAPIPWGNVSSAVESLWWVAPEQRSTGIGTELFNAGMEWAEIMGCDLIEAHDHNGKRIHKCVQALRSDTSLPPQEASGEPASNPSRRKRPERPERKPLHSKSVTHENPEI